MEQKSINICDTDIRVYSLNTVIVGSGAAGFNAADRLFNYGQKDIAIVTEGINKGTSRNTGSDKQTYYKLTLSGDIKDSVQDMAETLFSGGSMQGDIALVEAALSTQCFFHLVDIGVPFPHNKFGEYVGYKTDHDPRVRATSVGPLTSKFMTEKLQEQVESKGINIFDKYQVISIFTHNNKAIGLLCLDLDNIENKNKRYVAFNCTNIIYAVGAPSGIYRTSVYPKSQTGASGIAFDAGVKGKNLTEWQYGIASIKFRWNLSGTYQQVIPRYISTNQDGSDERDFLEDYFKDTGKMLDAIFLKGYQWPFDPRKIHNYGSSLIDVLVYYEKEVKGRRVFLDFTKNPKSATIDGSLKFNLLGEESYKYLKNSNALQDTPIQRLMHMNKKAVLLYKDNGIDLSTEYLEIAVCAQHNNGGLYGDIWWQSNLKHFFPVGEVNGTHGVYRPGGSALNSGQVGSTRAAQYICARYKEQPLDIEFFNEYINNQVSKLINIDNYFIENISSDSNIADIQFDVESRMTKVGAHVRSQENIKIAIKQLKKEIKNITSNIKLSSIKQLPQVYKNKDFLITQYIYLCSMENYIENGGRSRGSYLIYSKDGELPLDNLPEEFRYKLDNDKLTNKIQQVLYKDEKCIFEWIDTRPIPKEDNWFENVWNDYNNDKIIY